MGTSDPGELDGGSDGSDATVGPRVRACSTDSWCWELPDPQGNELRAIWTSPSLSVAVGRAGTILHGTPAGWQSVSSPTRQDLRGVWGADPQDIWAVGTAGTILRFDGHAWSVVAGPDSDSSNEGRYPAHVDWFAIDGSGPTNVWAVGTEGALFRYDGREWKEWESPDANRLPLRSVWTASETRAFAVGRKIALEFDGTVWRSIRAGAAPEYWLDVHGNEEQKTVWVVGTAGTAAQYVDGVGWQARMLPPGAGSVTAVVVDAAGLAHAFGDGGAAYSWTGQAWLRVASGTTATYRAAAMQSDGAFLLAGQAGLLQRWRGDERETMSVGKPSTLSAVHASSPGGIWAAGDTVLTQSAEGWREDAPETHRPISGVCVNSSTGDLWAVGTAGNIYVRTSAGWIPVLSPTTEWLRAVFCFGSGGWAVGAKGTILGLINSTSWQSVPSPTTQDLHGVWAYDANQAWAVGAKGTVLELVDGTWQPDRRPVPPDTPDLSAIWGAGPGALWAVGANGTILDTNAGAWVTRQTGLAYTLHAVSGTGPADVWAAGTDGTMLHWDGVSWSERWTGTRQDLRAVWATAPSDAWAVGELGMILRYQPLQP